MIKFNADSFVQISDFKFSKCPEFSTNKFFRHDHLQVKSNDLRLGLAFARTKTMQGQSNYRQLLGNRDDFDDSDSDTFENTNIPGVRSLKGRRVALHKCLIVALVVIVMAVVIVAISLAAGKVTNSGGEIPAYPVNPQSETVKNVTNTTCGLVEGMIEDEVFVFKGIPYAAPPIGQKRWTAPVARDKAGLCGGNNTFKAVKFGSKCSQWNKGKSVYEGDEDCLFLNVWTPTLDTSAELGVMVYIHGGSLVIRSGAEPEDAPTPELVKDTNMVYVSINYRLNAFGFLALKALSEASPNKTSGNYGFMDQILALKWVKENIRHFGGDPGKVTVYGQSSGGTSLFVLLASPMTEGLFQNAWAMSGSANFKDSSLETAEKTNEIILNNTKCAEVADKLKCLKGLTAEEIVKAWIPYQDVYPAWNADEITDLPIRNERFGNLAIVDGYVLPDKPVDVWKNAKKRDIRVLVGTTAQEVEYLLTPHEMSHYNQSAYEEYVRKRLDTFNVNISDEAIALYKNLSNKVINATTEYQYTTMTSDIRVTCGTNDLARAMTNLTENVFRYVVTSKPSRPIELIPSYPARYAFHGWDLLAFTGTIDLYYKDLKDSDKHFMNTMRHIVKEFVNWEKPLIWQPFPNAVGMIGDYEDIDTVESYHKEECNLWERNGLIPDYAWKN